MNPYLAFAGTLACGYLGMIEGLQPEPPHKESVFHLDRNLPEHLSDALSIFSECDPIREIIGDRFVRAFVGVKYREYSTYLQVISSWEREHLLLNV